MISAGFIGGGTEFGNPPPYITPPPIDMGTMMPTVEMKGEGLPAGNLTQEQVWNDSRTDRNSMWGDYKWMWGASMGANFFSNLMNQIFGYKINARFFEMQENITDRKAEAAETISADQRAVQERFAEFAEKADRNMNAPGGLRERLAQIESNRDIEMYERRMDSQERIAALRSLDNAFSVRGEYNYGNPYA